MGTRRSRHNRGRKPFYKNIERTTLADIAPVEASGWEAEADAFLEDRRLNNWRESVYAPFKREPRVPKADPHLTDMVRDYLEKRKTQAARKEADSIFPTRWRNEAEKLMLPSGHHDEAEKAEPSRRDILIELFVERKITTGQMHAGRRWQAMKEYATLQPSQSIDWSHSVGRALYQMRGSVTERQWSAMKWRRRFLEYAGIAATTMLDFLLEADRSRADLIGKMQMSAVVIESSLDELLDRLCECFGMGQWRERRNHYFRH